MLNKIATSGKPLLVIAEGWTTKRSRRWLSTACAAC